MWFTAAALDISAALKQFDIKSEFINGTEVTDEETMKVAHGSYRQDKKGNCLSSEQRAEGNRSPHRRKLIECKKYYTEVDGKKTDIGYVLGYSTYKRNVLDIMTESGDYIPVVAPIGVDDDGNSYNINAVTVAGAVAAAVKAEKLVLLTDIDGIKESVDSPEIIYQITKPEIDRMIADKKIVGGMIPKVKGGLEALDAGVNAVHIIDGRIPHCLLLEIFT